MHTEFGNFKSYKICKLLQMAPLLEFSYSPSQNCCTMYSFIYFLKKIEKPRCESLQKARGAKFWVNIDHNFDEGAIIT